MTGAAPARATSLCQQGWFRGAQQFHGLEETTRKIRRRLFTASHACVVLDAIAPGDAVPRIVQLHQHVAECRNEGVPRHDAKGIQGHVLGIGCDHSAAELWETPFEADGSAIKQVRGVGDSARISSEGRRQNRESERLPERDGRQRAAVRAGTSTEVAALSQICRAQGLRKTTRGESTLQRRSMNGVGHAQDHPRLAALPVVGEGRLHDDDEHLDETRRGACTHRRRRRRCEIRRRNGFGIGAKYMERR
mmetsp:Transcript_8657/g.22391  ORF Transcript_8657/g.22391 Transcript_8657/m.22391 type:complete len:249 (-) Transcript_8657:286-1032(-)